MKGIYKMNSKRIMAELYVNINLSVDEYIMKPVFSEIESHPEIIERLEKFHLPEITKLICCSATLLSFEWAKKYRSLSEYCAGSSPIKLENILSSYENMEEGINQFEEDFLKTGYTPLIKELYDQSKVYYEEINCIKAKIKEKTIEQSANIEKSENLKQLNDLAEQLNEKEMFIERFKIYFLILNKYYKLLSSDDENRRRKDAYKLLEVISKLSDEEKFVSTYVKSGILTDEYREKLFNVNFCRNYLKILEQKNNQLFAIPFLVHLHNQGEIDIESDIYTNFLNNHVELVVPYLIEEYGKVTNFIEDNTNKALLEILLYAIITDEKKFDYAELFNHIQDIETWNFIFSSALYSENKCKSIAYLLNGLHGKPVQYMLNLIEDTLSSDIKISIHDICEIVLQLNIKNNDTVLRLVGLLEQNQRKIQRKLNTSERIVKSQSQEIFSNLYSPMHDLEDLTASIKDTKKEIDSNLIAGKLFTVVEEFRSGLTSLGVDMVEDFDLWRKRLKISYDPQKHKAFLMDDCDNISEVKIRTLGFIYRDEDNIETKELAEICIDEVVPDNSHQKKSGYPKGVKINSALTLKGIKNNKIRNIENKKKKKKK